LRLGINNLNNGLFLNAEKNFGNQTHKISPAQIENATNLDGDSSTYIAT
jgi:hypothetical protein